MKLPLFRHPSEGPPPYPLVLPRIQSTYALVVSAADLPVGLNQLQLSILRWVGVLNAHTTILPECQWNLLDVMRVAILVYPFGG